MVILQFITPTPSIFKRGEEEEDEEVTRLTTNRFGSIMVGLITSGGNFFGGGVFKEGRRNYVLIYKLQMQARAKCKSQNARAKK